MDVKVDINPEDVNRMVVDAILKSTLGKAVQDAVKESVGKISRSYDNPLQRVIEKHIDDVILGVLHSEYKEVMKSKVQEALAGKITDDFVNKIVQKAFDAIYTDRR